MSSLEAVNKTLFGIREDTDELNKNFNKFFLELQRGKLDAEEDRRERAKMLAALGAAAAAAGANGGQNNNAGQQQQNEQNEISDLLKKAGLVLAGIGAAVVPRVVKSTVKRTYKVTKAGMKIATLPQRVGTNLGGKALSALSRKGDMDATDLRNAMLELNRQKRVEAYLRGQDVDGIGELAYKQMQINLENQRRTQQTLRNLGLTYEPGALGTPGQADKAPNILGAVDPITSNAMGNRPALMADVFVPNLELASRSRPLVDLLDDADAKRAVNAIQSELGVKYTVTPDGKIAAFTSDGKLLKAPVLDKALNKLSTLPPKQAIKTSSSGPTSRGNRASAAVRARLAASRSARITKGVVKAVPSAGLFDLLLNAYVAGEDVTERARGEGRMATNAEYNAMLAAGFSPDVVVKDLVDLFSLGSNFAFGTDFATDRGIKTQRAHAKVLAEMMAKRGIGQDTMKYLNYVARVKGSSFDPVAYQLYNEVQNKNWNDMTEAERANAAAKAEREQMGYYSGGMFRIPEGSLQSQRFFEEVNSRIRNSESQDLSSAAGQLMGAATALASAANTFGSSGGNRSAGINMPFSPTTDTKYQKIEETVALA